MKKIALLGEGNSGKTTTLNLVYHLLIGNGATVVDEKTKILPDREDFEGVLLYNGKKIAFYSWGDYTDRIEEKINPYNKYDVLIFAINREQLTKEQAGKLLDMSTDYVVHKKTDADKRHLANINDCVEIMRLLEMALKDLDKQP
jgi:hypothetical protein